MIRTLEWKPDFQQTIERFEAWWHGEIIDRPPLAVRVKPTRSWDGPPEHGGCLAQRWLDVEYQLERAEAAMRQRDYPGDAFPALVPNVGPELTATLLGCPLEFSEHTSWSRPVVHSFEEWNGIVGRPLDFDNPYWQAVERMTHLALERSEGRYLVGVCDLHDNYDTMAALRDPMYLCLDIGDDPDRIAEVAKDLRRVFIEAFARLWRPIKAAGMGCTTWTSIYHEGPAYLPSCDFWCMVGPELARDRILPDIRAEMAPLERSLFHLDGPDALRHLNLLLDLPELDAVQWTYGAGNGPASRWMGTFRRILDAGKSVHITGEADDLLKVLEALGPEGLFLDVSEPFDGLAAAETWITQVERCCGARA